MLRNYLLWERHDITEKAANKLIREFRDSIEFAKLKTDDIIDEQGDQREEDREILRGL